MDRNFALALGLSFLVLMLWTMFTESTASPGAAQLPPPGETGRCGATEHEKKMIPEPVFPEPGGSSQPSWSKTCRSQRSQRSRQSRSRTRSTTRSSPRTVVACCSWRLKDYDVGEEFGGGAVDLVTFEPEQKPSLATPFDELGFGDLSRSAYSFEQPDSKTLVFTREQGGIRIRKTYLFEEERYLFRLRLELENGSDRQIRATFRTRWPAAMREESGFKDYSLVARSRRQSGAGACRVRPQHARDLRRQSTRGAAGVSLRGRLGRSAEPLFPGGADFRRPSRGRRALHPAGAGRRSHDRAGVPGGEHSTRPARRARASGVPRAQDPVASRSGGRPSRRGDPQGLVPVADSLLHLAAGRHVLRRPQLRRGDHHRDRHGAAADGAGDGPADEVDEEDGRAAAEDEGSPGEIRATIARSSPRR